jgi:hypothetical protein
MTTSNRQAERERRFEALADFANLGDTPTEWCRFRSEHPHFFPELPSGRNRPGFRDLSEWMYAFAEEWANGLADLPPDRRPLPPLLWYRNRLRAVWTRRDLRGYAFSVLLGFDQEAQRIAKEYPDDEQLDDILCRPMYIPGVSFNAGQQAIGGLPMGDQVVKSDIFEGLPAGQPHVAITGRIEWVFGCILQQSTYEIMKFRWRMKVCPECKKFFVAKKTAQKHCSPLCYQRKKESASLEYYYREGKNRRAERRELETEKRKP